MKATKTVGPVLIHVITDKGRGYDPSLTAADRMHGVTKFDPRTGKQVKGKSTVSAAAYGYSPPARFVASTAADIVSSLLRIVSQLQCTLYYLHYIRERDTDAAWTSACVDWLSE